MKKLHELGYNAKTGIIGGISSASTVATEVMMATGDHEADLVDTLNWFGKVGLGWTALRLVNIGLGTYMAKTEVKQWEKTLDSLPTLEKPVSSMTIMSDIYSSATGPKDREMLRCFYTTERVLRDRPFEQEGSLLATQALAEDVNRAVNALAQYFNEPVEARSEFDRYNPGRLAAEMAYVLDRTAPIQDTCDKTPQTSDTGKFWFDFIEHQARERAYDTGLLPT